MKRTIFSIIYLALYSPLAWAQQEQKPDLQACTSMLLEHIQRDLQIRQQVFTITAELAKAQDRIKELEAKDKSNAEQKP